MGCTKDKIKRLVLISLVVTMIVSAITPPIMAADDTIHVTFDPEGDVSLEVSPTNCNFSTVDANTSEEIGFDFTLYNNGTIPMQTDCETNVTTDEGDLECDGNGGNTADDFFCLQFTDTTMDGDDSFISNSSGAQTTLDNSLLAGGSDTFRITIHLSNLSANHSWQTTTINFTGSVA